MEGRTDARMEGRWTDRRVDGLADGGPSTRLLIELRARICGRSISIEPICAVYMIAMIQTCRCLILDLLLSRFLGRC